MSAALREKLLKLIPFQGIPSYDARIADLQAEIEDNEDEAIDDKLDRLDDVSQTLEAVPQILRGSSVIRTYLNSVTGDDDNLGNTSDKALRSLDAFLSSCNPDAANYCLMEGDFELNESHSFLMKKLNVFFLKTGAGASITFKGGSILGAAGINLVFSGLDIMFDRPENGLLFSHRGGLGSYRFTGCTVDATQSDFDSVTTELIIGNMTSVTWSNTIRTERVEGRFSRFATSGNLAQTLTVFSNIAEF